MILEAGTEVVINSPAHRMDGYLGTIEYFSETWGTYGVRFGGMGVFGFLPSEVKVTS